MRSYVYSKFFNSFIIYLLSKSFTIVLLRKADLKFYKVVSLRRHTSFLPEKNLRGGETVDHYFLTIGDFFYCSFLLFLKILGEKRLLGDSLLPPPPCSRKSAYFLKLKKQHVRLRNSEYD